MKINEKYRCACKEVMYILSAFPEEMWNKIPQDRKDFYFNNMSNNYEFDIINGKNLDEYELFPETKVILAILYEKYLADEDTLKEIREYDNKCFNEEEKRKREKYNPDDIFKSAKQNNNSNSEIENEALIEIQEQKWYKKIFANILNFFKKK